MKTYKTPFIDSTEPEIYKAGTTFDEVLALYYFDTKLRELLLPELLKIEHVIKTRVVETFSKYHSNDHLSYLRLDEFNAKGLENFKRVNKLIMDLMKLIYSQAMNHKATQHYMEEYGLVPLIVTNTALEICLLC